MADFPLYPKIYGPYKRYTEGPYKNQIIEGEWAKPEFEALADFTWLWTEKVDGTNIRVHWDGHKVQLGGRTENAAIPAKLITVLNDLFREELLEQTFQETEVTLFGEGYGAGIQKGGGNYKADGAGFVLFDVLIGDWWLLRPNVEGIAKSLGVEVVPVILRGTVHDAVRVVRGTLTSSWGPNGICDHYHRICVNEGTHAEFEAEGLVGTTETGLLSRDGKRIQMKVKSRDFAS